MHEHHSIQELAYLLWEARGRPHGSAEQDWLDAERQLGAHSAPAAAAQPGTKSVDDALKDTFPASDPPAAHLSDEPPVNADQKWQAAGRTRATPKPKPAKGAESSASAKPRDSSTAAPATSMPADFPSAGKSGSSPASGKPDSPPITRSASSPAGAAGSSPPQPKAAAAPKARTRAAPKAPEVDAKPAGKKPPSSPAESP